MFVQIHKGGGIALFAGKKVFIDAQHARTGPIGHLRSPASQMVLVPALYGRGADLMRSRETTQCDPTMMRLEDLQTVRFRGPIAWSNARKRMAKIAATGRTMVFGHLQVQRHYLITLTRVLYRAFVGGLDPQIIALTVLAGRLAVGPGPYLNTPVALDAFDLKARYAYNCHCVGHRCSLH